MLNFEEIKDIKFKYYDVNGYIYPFDMVENSIKLKLNLLICSMFCKVTNLTANGEVFLELKIENETLAFRTDYFAASNTFTSLVKIEEESSEIIEVYGVDFGSDLFKIELYK